jgi:acyl dehydratase
MRLIADGLLNGATSMGAPGVEEVKWVAPVRPGDELRTRVSVIDARPSKSRAEIGLLQFAFEVLNQGDETVLRQQNWIMLGRQGHPWPPGPGGGAKPGGQAIRPELAPPRPAAYLDEMVVGEMSTIGAHTFTAEDIIRFARQFDPQPFHLDEEAARRSIFGGIIASGWHTASITHRLRVEGILKDTASMGSPGLDELRWLKPVRPGDALTLRMEVVAVTPSRSKPDRGALKCRMEVRNQHGEVVMTELANALFARRSPTA